MTEEYFDPCYPIEKELEKAEQEFEAVERSLRDNPPPDIETADGKDLVSTYGKDNRTVRKAELIIKIDTLKAEFEKCKEDNKVFYQKPPE